MKNPAEVIRECKELAGANAKVIFLKKNAGPELKFVVEQACSPFITFGIKQYGFEEPLDHGDFEHNFEYVKKLLALLACRSITGKNAEDAIRETSKHLNAEQQFVLDRILSKDLDCGIGAKTVAKIWPDLIPSFDVQLANKGMDKINFPCLVEPKRNGKRILAFVRVNTVDYFSRNGKRVYNLECFDRDLIGIAAGTTMVFDGEVSGNTGDHTKDYKIAQSIPKNEDATYDSSELRLTIWDMMTMWEWKSRKCNTSQLQRANALKNAILKFWEEACVEEPRVFWSRGKLIKTKKGLEKYYAKLLKMGHEGAIVKDIESPYTFKRSNAWIKMKVANDIDLKIVDVVEGKKSWKKTLAAIVVDYKGNKVHCGVKGFSRDELKEMWKKRTKLIGKTATVVYMNETKNDDGSESLYLPKFTEIRDDK